MKIIVLIKICYKQNLQYICIAKNLYDAFSSQNVWKQGDTLLPSSISGNDQENLEGLELNGIR